MVVDVVFTVEQFSGMVTQLLRFSFRFDVKLLRKIALSSNVQINKKKNMGCFFKMSLLMEKWARHSTQLATDSIFLTSVL